jgi:hypothetical protein
MKPKKAIALAIVVLLGVSFLWLVTRGNVVWRVHHHYPTAVVRPAPVNSPDLHWGDFVRLLGIRFRAGSEYISIRISDQTVDLDDFRGMSISFLTLTRCRLSDLRPILSKYHGDIALEDCDLSGVPADQLEYYRERRPYPGVKGLEEYSLFP